MSGEVEAAGAAVTAGLAAAAIDGSKRRGRKAAGGPCANCGAALTGSYCATCGQPAHIHRSLLHMVGEFLHGVFHFDTRAWKTLPLLLFRPGTLTHDYIHGKRARYVSPLAMFLLAVFAMFFVFELSDGLRLGVMETPRVAAAEGEVGRAAGRMAQIQGEVTRLSLSSRQRDAAEAPAAQVELEAAKQKLTAARADMERLAAELEVVRKEEAARPPPVPGEGAPAVDESRTIYDAVREEAASGNLDVHTGSPSLDDKIKEKLENPELAVYRFQDAASKYAFLLAPISLPFVFLMFFWKRGVTLFDHTVFILYSLSFASLLFIATLLIGMIPGAMGFAWAPLLAAGPVHAYFHIKGGYGLGWFSALWRMPFLLLFACICLVLFLLTILVLGVVG